ncbi:MAG: sugar ABC transporter permease [Acholeplasmatales bacterium]|jgi:arabinogalactan oligomer/maltooligosaccharide transport system permease protein|nr:sugar ABC transporter permease [Acholeplasmatales bacterium]
MKKISLTFKNFFINLGKGIKNFFKKLGGGFLGIFKNLGTWFKKGSLWTKLTFFLPGLGNLARKQIIKGLLFLGLEVLLLLFLILSPVVNNTPFGFRGIINFFTLGSYDGTTWTTGYNPITNEYDVFIAQAADNSLLMLLFGLISIAVLVIFIILWYQSIKSSYQVDLLVLYQRKVPKFKDDAKTLVNEKFHTSLLAVPILGVLVFTVLPIIFMIFLAFTDYSKTTDANGLFNWVGFSTFIKLFSVEGLRNSFGSVLLWTIIWAVGATFSNYYLGIMLAVLINKKEIKLKKLWRTIFILTIALPQFVSLLVVGMLIDVNGPFGHLLPFEILTNEQTVWIPRIAILIINLWVGVPYTMLLTTGILMNIPTDLYEAAKIDGASKMQMFRYITLPYVFFITTPALITSFMGNITSFNIIYLLTGGAGGVPPTDPSAAGGTDLLVTWLYKMTVVQRDYNIGAVISIITFIILSIGTLITYRRSKSYKEEEAFQ